MRILNTERLYLREFLEDDLEKLSAIYADEEVMKYIGKGGVLSREKTLKIINAWMKKYYNEYGFGIWAIVEKHSGLLIGQCGFNWLQDRSDIEIAYLLAKEFWGKGLATEISKATLEHGFNNLNFDRVAALSYPQNLSSINVINKLGMKPEGIKTFFDINFLFYYKEKPM